MTNLTIKELKAICLDRNIIVTSDKRLKASYINAIEAADTPNFEAMTEAECEVWMEEATGIKIGTVATVETKTTAEVEMMAEAIEKMLEAIADGYTEQVATVEVEADTIAEAISDYWVEQATEVAEGKFAPAKPAVPRRPAVTVALIPIIMVIAAVGLVVMTIRVLVPLFESLSTATAGLLISLASRKVAQPIDYFPNPQPAS